MNKNIQPLLEKITVVETEAALAALFAHIHGLAQQKIVRVGFVNAHGFNMAWQNPAFARDLTACDYIFRDGSGMKILYRLLGRPAGLNLNGTDLIPRILQDYRGQSIALFGTSQPYLDRAADIIELDGSRVVARLDGFQAIDLYVRQHGENTPDLTILAMGMPKQEDVATALASQSRHTKGLVVCGGAILDFMAGKVTRAPEIFRKAGMEWIYRLALEPKRLFKRYVLGNGLFLMRAVLVSITAKGGKDTKIPS